MQITAPSTNFPMVGLRIGLVSLSEHHDGPDSPIVVVKNHALLRTSNRIPTLSRLHRPGEDTVLTLGLQCCVLCSHLLNLSIRGEVAHVVLHAATMRVRIVAHHLVQVASQVIALWVPHAVLIVDQNHLSGVMKRAKNIVFLTVVMGEHDFTAWY